MEIIKILIVDDHTVVRDGLSTILERPRDFVVVGEAKDGLEAVEKARDLTPDVVLMDLRMPEMDGVEAMRRIRAEEPETKFIVLTTFDNDEYIFDAIEAGARGYLLKDALPRRAVSGGPLRPSWRVSDPARGGRQGPRPASSALPPERRVTFCRWPFQKGGGSASADGWGSSKQANGHVPSSGVRVRHPVDVV